MCSTLVAPLHALQGVYDNSTFYSSKFIKKIKTKTNVLAKTPKIRRKKFKKEITTQSIL